LQYGVIPNGVRLPAAGRRSKESLFVPLLAVVVMLSSTPFALRSISTYPVSTISSDLFLELITDN
jgi:hypothetical protein